MTTLYLGSNAITNISPVSELTNLTTLQLDFNQITDISAVSGLANLTTLSLALNKISNISPVAGLTGLTSLSLWQNQISDISPLSSLTNLTTLRLERNQISDISTISRLANVTSLSLQSNQISDISPLSGATQLIVLRLDNNQITAVDLRNANPPSLGSLSVTGNPIKSVILADAVLSQKTFNSLMDGGSAATKGLAELPGILTLDMSGVDFSGISDMSKMYTMDDLETLLVIGATHLNGSKVVLLTAELDSLNWLNVTGLWEGFDASSRSSLGEWDTVEGNTLITGVPEPSMPLLWSMIILAVLRGMPTRRVTAAGIMIQNDAAVPK